MMTSRDHKNSEQEINDVLAAQDKQLESLQHKGESPLDERIAKSEELLKSLGYGLPERHEGAAMSRQTAITVPSWEEIYGRAIAEVGEGHALEELFTDEELMENSLAVWELNDQYNQLHRLDKLDMAICAGAGIIAGIIDILLVGIPEPCPEGVTAGPMSNAIRAHFDKAFPKEEMDKLANMKFTKVPYDAQDNRNTKEFVEGLSTYYHRLCSLGHDPLLGLIIGVKDIMAGTMTTIDKKGNVLVQVMENYADRKETDLFEAVAKQLRHFASDVNTSMGLPAPLAGLFNLAQFGKIGDYEQTVAEIAQGMYYQGYDFQHFCSMSIPTMFAEVFVRVGYAIKRISEGHGVLESLPITTNREKRPKLGTMLFIAHSASTAINAGKIYVSQGNPMAINYTQWLAFGKYAFQQAKWNLVTKPEMRHLYVEGEIDKELEAVYESVDKSFLALSDGTIIFCTQGIA